MQFHHTMETAAPAERIWELWTDVASWPRWDTALVAAQLDGPFALHGQGRIWPAGSAETVFTVVELVPGQSYTIVIPLPRAQLRIRRVLERVDSGTQFTHDVSFVGPLGALFGWILGRRYRTLLPPVMEQLRQLAEQPSASRTAGIPT